MEIPFGNVLPSKSSAYSFLVLLIRFYEGMRLTHQTSESGPSATSGDVRYSAAMVGIADVPGGRRRARFRRPGSETPYFIDTNKQHEKRINKTPTREYGSTTDV